MPKYRVKKHGDIATKEILDKILRREERVKLSGNILKHLRTRKGLSQNDLAHILNVAQPTYAGYEIGKHEPGIDILFQLADFYSVTLDFITGRVFDNWIIEPFACLQENGDGHLDDLINYSKMQYVETTEISYMVMEAKNHGEYTSGEPEPSTNYRKLLRMKIKAPADAGA